MNRVAVVYWSGTGNTGSMAAAVAEGIMAQGAQADVWQAAKFDPALLDGYDAIAFGCPAMGAEELEEEEFAPMFAACGGSCAAGAWRCSAPTAGATASGCAPGRPPAAAPGPSSQRTA